MTSVKELTRQALGGDLKALQELRNRGIVKNAQKESEPEITYPLSHAQRRLWILDQIEERNIAYNMPGAFLLKGHINQEAFENAFSELILRHESLRTSFVTEDGEPRQKILDISAPVVCFTDLTSETRSEEKARELAREHAITPFDLEKAPLVRVSLLALSKTKHVMLFNMHHIISDGWSVGILVRELCFLYNALREGEKNPLSPLRIHYKDYAAWQNRLLESEAIEPHRNYWLEKLSGEMPVLNLPTDYPRPSVQTFNGKTLSFSLHSDQTEKLHALSNEKGVSLFMLLLAAVKVLLFRYTGQEDIIVGIPVAGRNHADIEDQIGFYVNTLVLRDQVRNDADFDALLRQVRETATEAYDHQIYPFDKLIEELEVHRDVGRSPLFDVMVALQDNYITQFSMDGLEIELFLQNYSVSKFDLTFHFTDADENLGIAIEYNTDIFTENRIRRMVSHFRKLADSILRDPNQQIHQLDILPEEEQNQLLYQFNNTDAEYPRDKTIPDLFEEQAEKRADRVAVVFGNIRLTYRELNKRANCLGRYLREACDVKPDERIAVILDRTDWMISSLLGILKAGGAYVPIDPAYPHERIRYILDDSACRVIITEAKYEKLVSDHLTEQETDRMIVDVHAVKAEEASDLSVLTTPDNAAYVIYTSGSTGQPKGCVITHRNVVRLMKNDKFHFHFSDEDVWVVAHSFCFDFSVWEMYGALLYGGKMVVAKQEETRDPNLLLELVREHRVSVLNQTPAAFYNFIEAEMTRHPHDLDAHLRYVIFGGDKLNPVYLRSWAEQYPLEKIRLINMYGITETTVHVTYFALFPGRMCLRIRGKAP